MSEIITVGLDLAKNVFQAHGADASGHAVLRKKLRRDQVLAFFSHLRPCFVAMEACGGAHFWGREIGKLGHEVRLIPPAHVKPVVKRQKNDAADAEAICEAAQRPTMRFVPVKSEETQGAPMVFHIRELLIRQRTQVINALRGHLGEFGQIVPQGAANAARLIAIVNGPDSGLPSDAIAALRVLGSALSHLEAEIGELDAEITRRAKENDVARRLMTVPGIGPLIATAIAVLAPPPEIFRKAHDVAAWLGLTPRQHSTGGKQRLGATTRMGERSLRRLLIIGANSVIIKRHVHAAPRPGTWPIDTLLRASHIKPWADCETDAERLDAHNGLLLSALWDAVFDKGLVTFEDDGLPIFSTSLSSVGRSALHVSEGILSGLTDRHRKMLRRHRSEIFQN